MSGKKTIVKAKQVHQTLKTYFQKSFLDVPHVMDFMTANKITRYCGAINLKYTKICSRICKSQTMEVGINKLKYPYIIKGNAVFYEVSKIF